MLILLQNCPPIPTPTEYLVVFCLNTQRHRSYYLKGLAMIFPGQENPFIIFRSKEIYIYSKTNNEIPIYMLK